MIGRLLALSLLSSWCQSLLVSGDSNSRCGQVFITVSSLSGSDLELNWNTDCPNPDDLLPDRIALFSKDVLERNERQIPLVSINPADYPSGYYKTKISFGEPWLPGNWEYGEPAKPVPGPHCFPYWIASFNQGAVLHSRCLAIQPTWMADMRDQLDSQKIGAILIPGTHNSGAYGGIPPIIREYAQNQDRDIWTQLVFGIRYLDFRIGYYEGEGFFINHDLIRIIKVERVFEQIRKFVELAPGEFIVIDFHRFPFPNQFNDTLHRKFLALVERELGHLVGGPLNVQVGKGNTFHELAIQPNKRLLICYNNPGLFRDYYWIWYPISQSWANTKDVNSLKNFIKSRIQRETDNSRSRSRNSDGLHTPYNPMYALMAILTPSGWDPLFRTNDLRHLADKVNRKVSHWFKDELGPGCNIVATDFFLGNDLINVAIEHNKNASRIK